MLNKKHSIKSEKKNKIIKKGFERESKTGNQTQRNYEKNKFVIEYFDVSLSWNKQKQRRKKNKERDKTRNQNKAKIKTRRKEERK